MKIEVIRSAVRSERSGRYPGWWRIRAANGEKLAHSETFSRYADALKAARRIVKEMRSARLAFIDDRRPRR